MIQVPLDRQGDDSWTQVLTRCRALADEIESLTHDLRQLADRSSLPRSCEDLVDQTLAALVLCAGCLPAARCNVAKIQRYIVEGQES